MRSAFTSDLASVIIPTFNRARSVAQAVESVLAQHYPYKQIIVVDDGSTDDTASRMARLPGVEYYYQQNRRQGAARNCGLTHAKGEFIASLDSDDIWQPNFLTDSIGALNEFHADLSFSNWTSEGLQDRSDFQVDYLSSYIVNPKAQWHKLTPAQTREVFLRHCPAPSSAAVIRRAAIVNGWNEQTRISDDWLLWLDSIFHRNITAIFTARPLWIKRLDGINIYDSQADSRRHALNEITDVSLIFKHYGGHLTASERALLQRRQASNFFDLAYCDARELRRALALRHYLVSFKLHPNGRTLGAMAKLILRRPVSLPFLQ